MGYEDREPDSSELAKMKQELRDALESGAFGMSSGLVYPPGCYAKTDELIILCKIVREHNGIYATHMRDEGNELETALNETINISKESGVKTQISHIKTWGQKNWWKIDKIENLLKNARAEDIKITCDRYPYTAAATDLDIILPDWVYEGGASKEKTRLEDPLCRERIIKEMEQEGVSEEFWGTIMISSVFNKEQRHYEGKTIAEISNVLKIPSIEFVLDLLYQEDCRVGVIFFNMSEENLARILKWDFVMAGSDSSLRSLKGILNYGKPHPRGYGTFSRIIRKYVNETSILSIEEAIYKMTGLPSQTLGLKYRGLLKEGFFADITIFDQRTISEQATFAIPHNYSTGIKHVLVNGKLTVKNGQHKNIMNGAVLKS
ncbi:N-acyl-D-aspartate/D-glutamate deacylase [Candidatus Scalindua japonica]|uniref:N-acyl-D-aspartate/D-glutamate deacylase n=1 Tax=Candidatus Scalindua japonica TaxID=1284222 RepID=A0A286TZX1_9BACT|nr:amidohydrolase family protein [Candidatus Scalindua japonica]GAX61443.1 N-acyl-D-aspartate/D-glutamate deacylase [Candidatus Scalindua japonica]